MQVPYMSYKNSPLATFISITSTILILSGIYSLQVSVVAGLIMIVIGGGCAYGAYILNESVCFKKWKKQVVEKGLVPYIQSNDEIAIKLYNKNPGKRTQKFIQELNPRAGKWIEMQLQQKKQREKKK